MSVESEHGEVTDEEESRIKEQKIKDKSAFGRIKNKLLSLLEEEDYPSRLEVKAVCQKLCGVQPEGGRSELGSGSLYLSLCKKLTEAMLIHYHRCIHENGRWQSLKKLREFIQEAEFQTLASETIHGLSKKRHKKDSGVTFFGNTHKSSGNLRRIGFRQCKVYSGHHGVWRCDRFKAMNLPERW